MSIMDGKKDPVEQLERALGSHVRMWGVIDLDRGCAMIKATCRRCGAYGEWPTQDAALKFRTDHRNEFNKCPHEKDVTY